MISETTLQGFIDEMEKISGVTQNVGMPTSFASRVASGVANWGKGLGNNLVGTAAGFANPIKGLKAGWEMTKNDIRTGHPAITGLVLLGTAMDAKDALQKEDPSQMGRSRVQRVAKLIGGTAGGIIGTPFGLSGGIAGSMAGEAAGGLVGKGIDRLRGRRPNVQLPMNFQQQPLPPRDRDVSP